MNYHAKVYVTLRPSVLDPAGVAVESGIKQLGYLVNNVRIGKYIELAITAPNTQEANHQIGVICDQLLANPIIENYTYELSVGD